MKEVQAVEAVGRLDYPRESLEVIVARGCQPSVQRNVALKAARGNWIYFLDDDALPLPSNLQRLEKYADDPKVAMVGGPNVCPPAAPQLEQVFAVVHASWIAFGPSRARYFPVGRTRPASEKELILCNTLARREILLEAGGFNEQLYPNEENALMDDLQRRGYRLVYDPEFVVCRRPRRTLKAFFRMLRTYGRGRAEQFRLHPTCGSIMNFVPPMFCVYLVALVLAGFLNLSDWLRWGIYLPLIVYLAALMGQTIVSFKSFGVLRSALALPLLFATHVLYGVGFWRGMFTNLDSGKGRKSTEVALEVFNHSSQAK